MLLIVIKPNRIACDAWNLRIYKTSDHTGTRTSSQPTSSSAAAAYGQSGTTEPRCTNRQSPAKPISRCLPLPIAIPRHRLLGLCWSPVDGNPTNRICLGKREESIPATWPSQQVWCSLRRQAISASRPKRVARLLLLYQFAHWESHVSPSIV